MSADAAVRVEAKLDALVAGCDDEERDLLLSMFLLADAAGRDAVAAAEGAEVEGFALGQGSSPGFAPVTSTDFGIPARLDRQAKLHGMLSNLLKKHSDVASGITQNLK